MSSEKPLLNCSILVTRPKHQAETFCKLLEHAGAQVIRFPAIEIEATTPNDTLLKILKQLAQQDMLVFTSRNAVQFALPWLLTFRDADISADTRKPIRSSKHCKIAAIGKQTALLLQKNGITVDIQPQNNFSSESLLALPEMQTLANQHILIIKGEGGRQLLTETFISRGAQVQLANVYRRQRPIPNESMLTRLHSTKIDIITLTSVESSENLFSLLSGQAISWLHEATLLLGSQRIKKFIDSRQLSNPVWVANNPSNDEMLAALIDWKAQHALKPKI